MSASRNGFDAADLSFAKHLRFEPTPRAGVWRLWLPRMLWNRQAAEVERALLIKRLTELWPYRALWFSDWSSAGEGWRNLGVDTPLPDTGELAEGGWILLFFGSDPGTTLPSVSAIPGDEEAAIRLLEAVSAGALVASWVDDTEWLVAASWKRDR